MRDGSAGVASALREPGPDVVLLQEAPRLLGWRSSCRLLARRTGLVLVTGGRPAAGNLLLVAPHVRVVSAGSLLLPRRPGLHRRGAVLAVLEVDGARVAVAGTHLDLDPPARLDSARRVRAVAGRATAGDAGSAATPAGTPLVVGADVNEPAGEPAWRALSAGLVDAGRDAGPTFPARDPHRRIDALLVDPTVQVLSCDVGATGAASDHLPLVADLALGAVSC